MIKVAVFMFLMLAALAAATALISAPLEGMICLLIAFAFGCMTGTYYYEKNVVKKGLT